MNCGSRQRPIRTSAEGWAQDAVPERGITGLGDEWECYIGGFSLWGLERHNEEGVMGRRIKSSHNCGVPNSSQQEGKEVARLLLLMLQFEWRLLSGGLLRVLWGAWCGAFEIDPRG